MNRWVWVFLTILAGLVVGVIIIWQAPAQLLGASSVGGTAGYTPPITLQTIAGFGPATGSCTQGATGSTCATEVATMTPASPGFVGAWALVGSNAACPNPVDTADFLIGAATGIITLNSAVAAGTYYPCVRASQAGMPSSYQQVAITVNASQTIASMAPTSCSYQQGSPLNTAVCSVAITMSPASPPFSGTCSGSDAQFGVTTAAPNCNIALAENDICSSPPCNYSLPITASEVGLTPLTTTVTLTSSSGPSVPAAANAGCLASNGGGPTNGSCFKTLAMNMDFTGATQSFVGTIGPFSATTTSNWLDCAGAATPAMYAQGFGHPSPGCFYSIVSDAGSNSLKMSDPMGDTNGMELETANSSRTVGTAFPGQFYVEAMLRTDASSNAACPTSTPCTDFWSYASYGGSPVIEYDFIEIYNGNTDAGGANAISPSSYTLEQHSFASAGISGYSNLNYNIVGERITQDGAGSQSYCFYYNNTQVNAETYLSPLTGNCGVRGPDNTILANLATPVDIILQALGASAGTISSYFKWVHVWTCSNWNQAQQPTNNGWACTGTLMTSNP